MIDFDLERCMKKDGGKCLAGDMLARIVCTDRQDDQAPLVVLVFREDREIMRSYGADGKSFPMGEANESRDLRNLPEYQEVEVTLWEDPHNGGFRVAERGMSIAGFELYGQPVKVKFPKGFKP